MMRILDGILCLIMIGFAAVQYNDPDAPLWIAVYGGAAFWCGVGAFRPAALANRPAAVALGASLVAAVAGVIHWWPQADRFWMQEVWWVDETAREGMGVMIVLAALLVVGATAMAMRRRRAG